MEISYNYNNLMEAKDVLSSSRSTLSSYELQDISGVIDNVASSLVTNSDSVFAGRTDETLEFYGDKLHEVANNLRNTIDYMKDTENFIDRFVSYFDVVEKDSNEMVSLDSSEYSKLQQLYHSYGIGSEQPGAALSTSILTGATGFASALSNSIMGGVMHHHGNSSLLDLKRQSAERKDKAKQDLENQKELRALKVKPTNATSTAAKVTTSGAATIPMVASLVPDSTPSVNPTLPSTPEPVEPSEMIPPKTPSVPDQPVKNTPIDDITSDGSVETKDPSVSNPPVENLPTESGKVEQPPETNTQTTETSHNRNPVSSKNYSSTAFSTNLEAPASDHQSSSLTENIQIENTTDLFGDIDDYTSFDSSASDVGKDTSTGGSGVIPIAVGLGAAAAVGIGAKVYKDRKENNELDLNEDRPSNENKFWTTDESSVIHSEKDDYVQSLGVEEPTTYKAVERETSDDDEINKDTWEMPDTSTSSMEQMTDLLGNE